MGEGKALYELPYLLSLVDQAASEQQVQSHFAGLASQVIRLVAKHLSLTTASLLGGTERASEEHTFVEQACSALTTYFQQGFRRLLLIPWGGWRHMGSLLELAHRALSTATGETVSVIELTLPHVHVDGVSARGAFEGYVSIQAQLSPLMEAFPGWDRTWTRLSAGGHEDRITAHERVDSATVSELRVGEAHDQGAHGGPVSAARRVHEGERALPLAKRWRDLRELPGLAALRRNGLPSTRT